MPRAGAWVPPLSCAEKLLFSVAKYRYLVLLSSGTQQHQVVKEVISVGNQMTEMLKGTLEGIVLAILATRPAYGYEITARLRDQGFSDIVEGTVYALLVRIEQRGLVDVEKVPSEKGPPRKVYSLNAQGREQLAEFWRTWSFLAERIDQLRTDTTHDNARNTEEGDK